MLQGFSRPEGFLVWKQRVQNNVRIYAAEYMTVGLVIGIGVVVSHPWRLLQWGCVMLVLLACIRSWYMNEPWTVYGVSIQRREQCLLLGPFAVAVVVFGGLLTTIMWVVFVTVVVDLGHASLHEWDPSIHTPDLVQV